MAHSYPSVYSVSSYFGDDPLIQTKPLFAGDDPKMLGTKKPFQKGYNFMGVDPLAAAQAYGIRWLLVHKGVMQILDIYQHPETLDEKIRPEVQRRMNPEEFQITHGPPYNPAILGPLYQHSRQVLDLPELEVREIQGACRPMAFAEATPDTALPIHTSGRGATVDLESLPQGGAVVVNFLAWPHMQAAVDGQSIAVSPDEWGRIRTIVPAGAKQLVVRYVPPWGKGLLCGTAIAFVTGAGAVVSRTVFRRKVSTTSS